MTTSCRYLHRLFQKAFDPNTAMGGGGGTSSSSSTTPGSSSIPKASAPYNKDFEDLTLRMLRQAAERQKLEKQLREEQASSVPATNGDTITPTTTTTPASTATTSTTNGDTIVPPNGSAPTPSVTSSSPSSNAPTVTTASAPSTHIPPTKSLFGGFSGSGSGSAPATTTNGPTNRGGTGGASIENDILARMRMMSSKTTKD